MALIDKLTAIADAIRGKTGSTEEMTLDQMAGEISGIQTGGGNVVGDNSVPNTVDAMLYAITSGTAKSGSFTFASPLPAGENLIFSTGLDKPNGVLIFASTFLNNHINTQYRDNTGFSMWLANSATDEDGLPIGMTFGVSNSSAAGNKIKTNAPWIARSKDDVSYRIENGNLYVEPQYANNQIYTPFGAGVTYYWFAW